MSKNEWRIAWQRARLNRRNACNAGYEFYEDKLTHQASDLLIRNEMHDMGVTL